jgi:hypothetical protein
MEKDRIDPQDKCRLKSRDIEMIHAGKNDTLTVAG